MTESKDNLVKYELLDNPQNKLSLRRMMTSRTMVISKVVEACAELHKCPIRKYHHKHQYVQYNINGNTDLPVCCIISTHRVHFDS